MKKLIRLLAPMTMSYALLTTSPVFASGLEAPQQSLWGAYVEAFVGSYYGNYDYRGNTSTTPGSIVLQTTNAALEQFGFLGGGAVGFFRNICPRFDAGVEVTGSGMTNQAITNYVVNIVPATPINIQDRLSTGYSIDLAGILIAHITNDTRFYSKLGGSYSGLESNFVANDATTGIITVRSQQNKSLFGLVGGIGIIHNLSTHFSVFTEFDYYYYPRINLTPVNNVVIAANGYLTRSIELNSLAIKTGVAASIQL